MGAVMVTKTQVIDAAIIGLDFYVRHQVKNSDSADCGRYPLIYDINLEKIVELSTNWETAILAESMLIGYRFTKCIKYFDSAVCAINYIKSLQSILPDKPRLNGVFREITPQTQWAHPRDALTAAWSLLDWYEFSNDGESLSRSLLFADWFIRIAMERGYPYWTIRFDGQSWDPPFWGSFHSGGAFYFYRLFKVTGNADYLSIMCKILDFYNINHLDSNGNITVALDCTTMESIDDKGLNTRWWEEMHKYNDDFGTLANLAAYKLTKNESYLLAARRFLKRMTTIQHQDGGFGPSVYSVPSASGVILIEALAAKSLGLDLVDQNMIESAVNYLLNIQVKKSDVPYSGAFRDTEIVSNARTGAYSIMALLRYAGITDSNYFITESL
jgi:hypothetical protein